MSRIGTRAGLRAAFVALLLIGLRPEAAASEGPPAYAEYAVKAAMLYHFARFTDWPEGAGDGRGLRICVLGDDPFTDELTGLDGKRVAGQAIATIRLTRIDGARHCQLLFISRSEEARIGDILAYLGDRPILTIGDMAGFAEAGGIITLKMVDDRIGFAVNLASARRSGLTLSAKVLALAEIYTAELQGPEHTP